MAAWIGLAVVLFVVVWVYVPVAIRASAPECLFCGHPAHGSQKCGDTYDFGGLAECTCTEAM